MISRRAGANLAATCVLAVGVAACVVIALHGHARHHAPTDVGAAKPCPAYVGQVLTVADATILCTDFGTVYPVSATSCTNGETWLSLGPIIGGIIGQAAITEATRDEALDRTTCTPR